MKYVRATSFPFNEPATGAGVQSELDQVARSLNNITDAQVDSSAAISQSKLAGTTLGYAAITGNLTTASAGTQVQATGLTITVTIPSGGRRVKITAFAEAMSAQGANYMQWAIWDGTVGSGTQLARAMPYSAGSGQYVVCNCIAVVTPSAGSKTYNVGWCGNSGTATLTASSTEPAFILAELI